MNLSVFEPSFRLCVLLYIHKYTRSIIANSAGQDSGENSKNITRLLREANFSGGELAGLNEMLPLGHGALT